ncbi:MAG: DNA-3-methyladenine glycosylase I [Chitinivibrionales bacterium]|nr:DNA-3-methyladenine glycosylase I [Chitinivibrionales bacterium]MBD3358315.1 DNA-3-methyladenine glycosylase I [Chitinivibrionales bacterium]
MPDNPANRERCDWAGNDPLYCDYHDNEWGVPVHNDRKLFEMLILEGFQAGLSWITILRKREAFRKAFRRWDWNEVARFTDKDVERLLGDSGIIRNRRKIEAAIRNAQAFERVRKEFGTFDRYIWRFTDGKTLRPAKRATCFAELPTHTPESDAMSKDLKKRGFSFVGTVICYAHMQATGMVDDHQAQCFKAQGSHC